MIRFVSILVFVFAFQPLLASSGEYGYLYVHRLKKSTNSGVTYKVFINDKEIGKFKGVNKAFSAKSKADWIVIRYKPEAFYLRILDKKEEVEKIIVQLPADDKVFVEFDPSAAYGYKKLRILDKSEGYQQVIDADLKDMQFLHPDLEAITRAIDMNALLALEQEKSTNKNETDVVSTETKQKKQDVQKTPVADIQAENESKAGEKPFLADVDMDIPQSGNTNPYRFALIIGNEDYSSQQTGLSSEVDVAFAKRDAEIFHKYAADVIGIPENNIVFETDADVVSMNRAINKLNLIIKNTMGKAEVFVYYAGHGLPDEVTKEPYLIPVNVTGGDLQFAIQLSDLYQKLTEYKSKRVTVFLDACFSGGARNQGLIAARGVKIKPKTTTLNKNIVVFSASTGNQSSLPYKEKRHGIFTYFLLKKLKETKGNLTYGDLGDYLKENVGLNSVMINNKEQNPQINISTDLKGKWRDIRF